MNKLSKILTFWIPVRKWRHSARGKINEFFDDVANIKKNYKDKKKFANFSIRKNSVLIAEPNPFHAEIIPGFVCYFQDLGFNVDVFFRDENVVDSPFTDSDKKSINIFSGSAKTIKKMLKSKKINKYEFVFISSSAFWDSAVFYGAYLNYLGFVPQAKNGIMMIEHNIDPYLHEYSEEKYLNDGRLFTLSGLQKTPMLNPHYFGEFDRVPKNKCVNFIVVGGINKDCKNHELLFDAAQKLIDGGYDFKITIIGGGGVVNVPENLKKRIFFLGRLKFVDMYVHMQSADFFLPLLDPTLPGHKRYLTGTTTGSRQLILGFLKPCLINEKFGAVYGFDNNNSILYSNNDLFDSMKIAIDLSQKEYESKQDNLKKMSDDIKSESRNNLIKSIKRIMGETTD